MEALLQKGTIEVEELRAAANCAATMGSGS
jgi:hypothetical protein